MLEGIARLESFFADTLGIPTRFSDIESLKDLTDEDFYRMAKRVRKFRDDGTIGFFVQQSTEDIVNIYRLAR